MKPIRNINDNGWSEDYEVLVNRMQQESVICTVDYHGIRDIAHTIYRQDAYGESWEIGVRGLGYFSAETREAFIGACQQYKVRFAPASPGGIMHKLWAFLCTLNLHAWKQNRPVEDGVLDEHSLYTVPPRRHCRVCGKRQEWQYGYPGSLSGGWVDL